MNTPVAVITGGAGFLGSHMCDRLINEGFIVICLDNLLTGRKNNLIRLHGHPRFAFLHFDVTEPYSFSSLVNRIAEEAQLAQPVERIDYVLHMASPASPVAYGRYPIETLRVGALGTYHSLELARVSGAVFLISSKSEEYGAPRVSPHSPTYWSHLNLIGLRRV